MINLNLPTPGSIRLSSPEKACYKVIPISTLKSPQLPAGEASGGHLFYAGEGASVASSGRAVEGLA
jgi:hypothetical protein